MRTVSNKLVIATMFLLLLLPNVGRAQDHDVEQSGNWLIVTTVNPITDEVKYRVGLLESSRLGIHGIVVFCDEENSSTGFAVGWQLDEIHFSIENVEFVSLTVRFDKKEPRIFRAAMVAPDNQPIVYLFNDEAVWFSKEASTSNRVALRSEVGGSEVIQVYSLKGAANAISKLECVKAG